MFLRGGLYRSIENSRLQGSELLPACYGKERELDREERLHDPCLLLFLKEEHRLPDFKGYEKSRADLSRHFRISQKLIHHAIALKGGVAAANLEFLSH